MFKDLLSRFEKRESDQGHVSIYPRGICYMYGHLEDDLSKECFEYIFDTGQIYEEIDRLCDVKFSGKVRILVRAYIAKLIERKHDYRLGWNMIIKLFAYINSDSPITDIYKNALNEIIKKDFYSEKIKNIIREINNARK